jgi:hypothetical protein
VTPTHSTHLPDLYQTVAMFFSVRSKVYRSVYSPEEQADDVAMLRGCLEKATPSGEHTRVEQSTFASADEMDMGVNPPEDACK